MSQTHDKIIEMQQAGLDIGARVEIVMKEGAEWCNGHTSAPTVDPQGYVVPEESQLKENPGLRGVGYISELKDTRLTLAPAWNDSTQKPKYDAGYFFVDARVIHSYTRL